MAISPTSDLVLDVLNAADPTSVEAAKDRLSSVGAAAKAAKLESEGHGFSKEVASLDKTSGMQFQNQVHLSAKRTDTPETYRQFEAMVLQNFIQSMLPDDAENVYGKGLAGDMWKSMMAQHIGSTLSESGGIGIADQLMRGAHGERISSEQLNAAQMRNTNSVASAIQQEQQMNILADLLPGGGEESTS